MTLSLNNIINTREDLDAILGTPAHDKFIVRLAGSMKRMENQAEYPENYNQPGYDGPSIEPDWVAVEDLSTIGQFGFTKAEIEGALMIASS